MTEPTRIEKEANVEVLQCENVNVEFALNAHIEHCATTVVVLAPGNSVTVIGPKGHVATCTADA